MNYELIGLFVGLIFNTLVIVAVMLSQNAKYDARFDAMGARIDAQGQRIDNVHKENMELIKKLK